MGVTIDYKQFMRDRSWFGYHYTSLVERTDLGNLHVKDGLEWGYLIDKSFGESYKPLYYVQSTHVKLSYLWPLRWWIIGKLNKWA